MITKKDVEYKPPQLKTKIDIAVWKLVHCFISTCIYLRTDGGRWVNTHDLDFMYYMYDRVKFDLLIIITKALKFTKTEHGAQKYLVGDERVPIRSTPPSSSHEDHEGASSIPRATNEELLTKLDELMAYYKTNLMYTCDVARWHGNMMKGLILDWDKMNMYHLFDIPFAPITPEVLRLI